MFSEEETKQIVEVLDDLFNLLDYSYSKLEDSNNSDLRDVVDVIGTTELLLESLLKKYKHKNVN